MNAKDLLRALEAVFQVVTGLGREDALDDKLAEYAFFPLSHIFNESRRVSERCLEVAICTLTVLINSGWRHKLAAEMGKQLLILLTLLAGGNPIQEGQRPRSEELTVAAFKCMSSLFHELAGPNQGKTMFDEVGTATIVDRTVYILLESITDSASDAVQLTAVEALQELYQHIHTRTILASLLPRTVSALTKTLRPTTEARRTHKVLEGCLQLLRKVLHAAMNDNEALPLLQNSERPSSTKDDSAVVLDRSWLNATSGQIKLALANIIQLRGHDKSDVLLAMQQLCLMVVEDCPNSLAESVPMMIDTLLVLAHEDRDGFRNSAFSALRHLAISSDVVTDNLRSSLHMWTTSLPRVMHGNDDQRKQRALGQISSAFEILCSAHQTSDILDESLANSICDGVAAAIHRSIPRLTEPSEGAFGVGLGVMAFDGHDIRGEFEPVLMSHGSQQDTMQGLRGLVRRLNRSPSSQLMAKTVLSRLHVSDGDDLLAAYWLSLGFLRQHEDSFIAIGEFLADDQVSTTLPILVSELYSYSLLLLLDLPSANPADWRLAALALESLSLQASHLRSEFRPELIDALYPVLQLLGSPNLTLRTHAMTTLNLLSRSCEYASTSAMLVDNVDYLVNAVALKLNTFDISPQAPQVLLMMVRLCGASLIPYLDDLIGSIFAALDSFHGYPKLVELLFSALSAIVDEGAKHPELAITEGAMRVNHKKKSRQTPTVEQLLREVEEKRAKEKELIEGDDETVDRVSAPRRPWTSKLDGGHSAPKDANEDEDEDGDEEEPLPPEPPEKPLTKTHTLLLNIASSTPPHLSSPSPHLRAQLLQLLSRAASPLSNHENSFLPLINDIWPSVISRLYDTESYVVVAATETISQLCIGAGDFMSSRVEDEFKDWQKICQGYWDKVESASRRRARNRDKAVAVATEAGKAVSVPPVAKSNSPDYQIRDALVKMWTTIMAYVRVTDDIGHGILGMLAPVMDEPGREELREVLENWNPDAVLQVRESRKASSGHGEGAQQYISSRPNINGKQQSSPVQGSSSAAEARRPKIQEVE